jgi:hypothetical protein
MQHNILVIPKDNGFILAGADARAQFIAEGIMAAIGGGRPYGTIEDAKGAVAAYQKQVIAKRPENLAVATVVIELP